MKKKQKGQSVRNWLQFSFLIVLCHLTEGGRKVKSDVESGKKEGVPL